MSDELWTEATRDHETEDKERRLASARVAASELWPFLAQAKSQGEYENRKALIEDRLAVVCPDPEDRERLVASLDEDFRVLVAERQREAQAKEAETQREAEVRARVEAENKRRAEAQAQESSKTADVNLPSGAADLIKRMEKAPDFGYDDEEKALNDLLGQHGLKWKWDRDQPYGVNKVLVYEASREASHKTAERKKLRLPYSEVNMHMRIAGEVMEGELVGELMVQLYDENGSKFSFPITRGEAGWDLSENRDGYKEGSLSERVEVAQRVVATKVDQPLSDGTLIDFTTAQAMTKVYAALTEENRQHFDEVPLRQLLTFVTEAAEDEDDDEDDKPAFLDDDAEPEESEESEEPESEPAAEEADEDSGEDSPDEDDEKDE